MKLVILDRDGTINQDSDDYIKTAEEWVPLPGSLEAIAKLNHASWHVVIASNQSGIGRGLFDLATMNAMHTKMFKLLAAVGGKVDAVFYCPHTPEDACQCRKPMPGLFEQIGDRYNLDLALVPAVGDSLRDVQAAHSAGCKTHLVLTGKGAQFRDQPLTPDFPATTRLHENLLAFVDYLLANEPGTKK